jgi:undecaprenyl-diphosphatase
MKEEALFLGLLQGVTEFLPISSSGHLAIAKTAMGVRDASLSYDLVLHFSTVLAVLLYFARDITSLLMEWLYGFFNANARGWAGWRFGWAVVIGVLVTAPLGILLKPFSEAASSNLLWLGGNLWITAVFLLSSRFFRGGTRAVSVRDGFFVGILQGLGVMPGISRSGSTMWAGLFMGLTRDEAFRFSFLLSVPTIIGATLYEARDNGGGESFILSLPEGWVWGAAAAFLSGLLSLFLLRKIVSSDRWWLFSIYCMVVGASAVVMYFMRV